MAVSNHAVALFCDWLNREQRGEPADIKAIAAATPEYAVELFQLHDEWMRLKRILNLHSATRESGSLADRLREQFGPNADPGVRLDDEEVPTDAKFKRKRSAPDDDPTLYEELRTRISSSGRYRLDGEIARGGMGVVIQVFDKDLRRNLAMKVMLEEDKGHLSRFLEEAQITGQLDHPGIVPVHELGIDQGGKVFFTMKLVKGRNLAEVFEMTRTGEEGWNITRTLDVLKRVCEAMTFAHEKKVIHRDLKPANIMVGRHGEAYVMDWGLARVLEKKDSHDIRVRPAPQSVVNTERRESAGDTPDSPLLTMDGDVVGTPSYMPLEQAEGDLGSIGPRSDVYAVGAILYHLLAGHAPYVDVGTSPNARVILDRVRQGPPESIRTLSKDAPAELVAICERAMGRKPAQRYETMSELSDDLRAFLERRAVRAYRTGFVVETKLWITRNRAFAIAAASAVLAVLSGFVLTGRALVETRVALVQKAKAAALERRERVRAEDAELAAQRFANQARRSEYVSRVLAAATELSFYNREAARRHLLHCPDEWRSLEWTYLSHLLDTSSIQYTDLGGAPVSIAWNPNGTRVIALLRDGTGVVLDVVNRRAIGAFGDRAHPYYAQREQRFTGPQEVSEGSQVVVDIVTGELIRTAWHSGALNWNVPFSSDGALFCVANLDGNVDICSSESGELLRRITTGGTLARRAKFICNDAKLAIGTIEGEVQIWSVESGVIERRVNTGSKLLEFDIALSGSTAITSGIGNQISVLDIIKGTSKALHWGHAGQVLGLDINESELRAVSFASDEVIVWNLQSGEVVSRWETANNQNLELVGVRWQRDRSDAVMIADRQGSFWRWDIASNTVVHSAFQPPVPYSDVVGISPVENRAFRSGTNGTGLLHSWPNQRDTVLQGHSDEVTCFEFAPDARLIATGSRDGSVRIWNTTNPDEIKLDDAYPLRMHGPAVLNHRGDVIASVGADEVNGAAHCVVLTHSTADGKPVNRLVMDQLPLPIDAQVQSAEHPPWAQEVTDGLYSSSTIAFSQDDALIATMDGTGAIRVFSAHSGLQLFTTGKTAANVRSITFDTSGAFVAALADSDKLLVWPIDAGKRVLSLRGTGEDLKWVRFSPTNTKIAAITSSRSVLVWEMAKCLVSSPERVLPKKYDRSIATTDASVVVSVDTAGATRLIDVDSCAIIAELKTTAEVPTAAIMHPDRTKIALVRNDEADVFDVSSGAMVATLQGCEGGITQLCFLSLFERIVTGSADGKIRLWDLPSGDCVLALSNPTSDSEVAEIRIAIGEDKITVLDAINGLRHWRF